MTMSYSNNDKKTIKSFFYLIKYSIFITKSMSKNGAIKSLEIIKLNGFTSFCLLSMHLYIKIMIFTIDQIYMLQNFS